MNQLQNRGLSIEQMTNLYPESTVRKRTERVSEQSAPSFQQILEAKKQEGEAVRFSKHANERLLSRNIQLSQEQRNRLTSGVDKASQKGIKDSLVLVDNMAFIVNVTNRTVITAVGEGDDQVFTNIDGAIIT